MDARANFRPLCVLVWWAPDASDDHLGASGASTISAYNPEPSVCSAVLFLTSPTTRHHRDPNPNRQFSSEAPRSDLLSSGFSKDLSELFPKPSSPSSSPWIGSLAQVLGFWVSVLYPAHKVFDLMLQWIRLLFLTMFLFVPPL